MPLYLPAKTGLAALSELSHVAWTSLQMAYSGGRRVDGLVGDVEAALLALGSAATFPDAIQALYSNVYHQGTVYEATAYAVPFLASVACEPAFRAKRRLELVALLSSITLSSTFETEDGSFRGAFGEDVGTLIREALAASAARIASLASHADDGAAAVAAMLAVITAEKVTPALFEALRAQLSILDERLLDIEDEVEPPTSAGVKRYRHPTFGDATLLERKDDVLRLRFDDGAERVIKERFVAAIED